MTGRGARYLPRSKRRSQPRGDDKDASWEESGAEDWYLLLYCPNCDVYRQGIHSQQTVDAFDEELKRGAGALARDYDWVMRANMAEEIKRFVGALNADAILPEDF
jgi:hypothetical protein